MGLLEGGLGGMGDGGGPSQMRAHLILAFLVGIVLVGRNARERSIDARPFVLLTLFTGSIGLLGYLARHDVADPVPRSEAIAG
jgi:hypothetical protein